MREQTPVSLSSRCVCVNKCSPIFSSTLPYTQVLMDLFPSKFPSQSSVKTAVRKGLIRLNGTKALPNDNKSPVQPGTKIEVMQRAAGQMDVSAAASLPLFNKLSGEMRPRCVVEDDYFGVVVKPQGLLTNGSLKGGTGSREDLLPSLQTVLPHVLKPSTVPGALRVPAICHRLDLVTGGLVVCGKTRDAHVKLQQIIGGRQAKKRYVALLDGFLASEGSEGLVDIPLYGKRSLSGFKIHSVIGNDQVGYLTTVSLYAKTGRNHQLRRHMSLLGAPILFDTEYAHGSKSRQFMLAGKSDQIANIDGDAGAGDEGEAQGDTEDVGEAAPGTVLDLKSVEERRTAAESPGAPPPLFTVSSYSQGTEGGGDNEVVVKRRRRWWEAAEEDTREEGSSTSARGPFPLCLWAVQLDMPHPCVDGHIKAEIPEPAFYETIRTLFRAHVQVDQ